MRYRFQSTQRSSSYILVPRAAILLASASARSMAPAKRIAALGARMKFIPKRVDVPRLRTFAPIATAHPYSARKFTCHGMHRARAKY